MSRFMTGVKRVFDWRVRGVRCVELVGVVLLAAVMVSVYIVKTAAARESTEISKIEAEIRQDEQRVRLLRAEATRLEQPARLEALSRQLGLEPVEVKRRTEADSLSELAAAHQPAVAAAPTTPSTAPTVSPAPATQAPATQAAAAPAPSHENVQ